MSSSPFSLDRCWRVILPLVAVFFLNPGKATAECGDYITILKPSTVSLNHITPTIPEPISNRVGNQSPDKPCHGPNCSSTPTQNHPPLAPITPVGSQIKELTHTLIPRDGESTPARSFNRDCISPQPIHRTSSIFHPPRPVC